MSRWENSLVYSYSLPHALSCSNNVISAELWREWEILPKSVSVGAWTVYLVDQSPGVVVLPIFPPTVFLRLNTVVKLYTITQQKNKKKCPIYLDLGLCLEPEARLARNYTFGRANKAFHFWSSSTPPLCIRLENKMFSRGWLYLRTT